MKSDLDILMHADEMDALIVIGNEDYSAVRDYLSNGARFHSGVIVKVPGKAPLLIVSSMEIDEARRSGLECRTYEAIGYWDVIQELEHPADRVMALWVRCLQEAGVEDGRVGVYGVANANEIIEVMDRSAHYDFVGEMQPTILDQAMVTKSADEIARITSVAERTQHVLQATWDFIAGHRADGDETLIQADDTPLTIGDVKRFVRRSLLDHDLEDRDMIFAQGREGGFPHSRGTESHALKLGQPIVFDLFPREIGGGYHHDVTRTWCIGYAPQNVQMIYEQVRQALDIAIESFGVNKPMHWMQKAVQDYFEAHNHPTKRTDPKTTRGYVHSLGHNIGLSIHEKPYISHLDEQSVFRIGNCLTIEPGLYYPDEGFGVRVEDLFIVTEGGELRSLTTFKKDLVIPLRI